MPVANAPKQPGPPLTIRLGVNERLIIAAAADERREPLSAFVRRVALEVACQELVTP